MSPARDQEYFCEGIAEELINGLAQIDGLRVAARTSAFQFKDKDLDVRRIGKELGVESVLEGSVRKAGRAASRHRAARERLGRLPSLVGEIRPRPRGHLRHTGRDFARDRREAPGQASQRRKIEARQAIHRQRGGLQPLPQGPVLLEQAPRGRDSEGDRALSAGGRERPALRSGVRRHGGLLQLRRAPRPDGSQSRVTRRQRKPSRRRSRSTTSLAEAHASLGWIKTFHDWDWAGAESGVQESDRSQSELRGGALFLRPVPRGRGTLRRERRRGFPCRRRSIPSISSSTRFVGLPSTGAADTTTSIEQLRKDARYGSRVSIWRTCSSDSPSPRNRCGRRPSMPSQGRRRSLRGVRSQWDISDTRSPPPAERRRRSSSSTGWRSCRRRSSFRRSTER